MIDRIFELLTRAIERVLALAFIGAVCLNFANVVARHALGESIAGADEVQIYVMVCMAFLGAAVVTWRRLHLRMDVIAQMMPPAVRRALQACELVLMACLTGITAFQSFHYAGAMLALDRRSDNAGIPMWLPHGAVALGFALISLITLWRVVRLARGDRSDLVGSEERAQAAEIPAVRDAAGASDVPPT
jgi:TRAP-type C4-dicarboxylate transport system permease small subunit